VVAFVVFVMLTCGTGGTVTVLVHGGGVLFGKHRPPLGGVTVAVFVTVAGGVAITVAVTVYVTVLPAGNVARVWFTSPLPEAFGHTAPPVAAQVQVWLAMPVGAGSDTIVPAALTLPVLLATIM
jgi:ABC-type transport system involved in cytochrome c biogenesis permease subunit